MRLSWTAVRRHRRVHPYSSTEIKTRAARLLLRNVVPTFLGRYPGIVLDLVTEGRLVDIVAEGFDAGVRLGEALAQDMIAVRFGGEARFLAVASQAYLSSRKVPRVPEDLKNHTCIRNRLPSGKLYRWEFEKRGREVAVDVPGALTLDSIELMTEAAAAGLGIAYVPDVTLRIADVLLAPSLPAASQLAVPQAVGLVEHLEIDDPVCAEMSEALTKLAPRDQQAARLGIA
jgi:DNA-binding transcriptional LysR family regulator